MLSESSLDLNFVAILRRIAVAMEQAVIALERLQEVMGNGDNTDQE